MVRPAATVSTAGDWLVSPEPGPANPTIGATIVAAPSAPTTAARGIHSGARRRGGRCAARSSAREGRRAGLLTGAVWVATFAGSDNRPIGANEIGRAHV